MKNHNYIPVVFSLASLMADFVEDLSVVHSRGSSDMVVSTIL